MAEQIGDAADTSGSALVADDGGESAVLAVAAATGGILAPPPADAGVATEARDLTEAAQAPSSTGEATLANTNSPVDDGAGPQLDGARGSPQPVMTWAGAVVEPDRPLARSQRGRAGVQQLADTQVGAQAPEAAGSAAATTPPTAGIAAQATQGAVGSAALATQAGVGSTQDVANVAMESKLDLATASQDPLFATIFLFAQQQTAGANGDPTSSDPETAGVQTAAIATDRASIHVLVLPALEQVVTAIAAFIPSTGGPGVAALLIGLTALGGLGVWLRRAGKRRS
jgi:hypothetical protein